MQKYMAKNHLRYLKGFSWFVVVISAVLVLGGTLSVVGFLPNSIWRGLDLFLTKMTQIFGFAAVYFAVTYLSGLGFFFSISILGLVILSSANLAYKKIQRKQEKLSA
ncbi:hypothetical protein V7111_01245 [Neobacillus niacini]|uniref:hypothetical protein n=1 Tax=Neobacillus niacini TaxID=86668 RepID=UPI002FFF310C